MTRFLSTASVLALTSLPVSAQGIAAEEIIQLEEITVFGNLNETPLKNTGANVAIVTSGDLARDATQSVSESLSRRAGVTFTNSGGAGGLSYGSPTNIRLRGLSEVYVPVLLNGIDISDPSGTQNSFNWSNILGTGITRAEVVKGTQSALYGSEAVAGVIGLTAAQAPEAGERAGLLELEVGSYGTRRATLNYGIAGERAGFAISASRATTDGFSAFSDGSDDDSFAGTQVSFDTYYDVTENIRVGLTGFSFNSDFDYDPANNTGTAKLTGLRAYLDAETGAVRHRLDVSRFRSKREFPLAFFDLFEGERDKFGYVGTWTASESLQVSYGADWTRETAQSFTEDETVTRGVFAEIQYRATPDLDLALSLRHDDHSEFGGFTSGRAALSYRMQSDLTLRASLANGFRAPSLNELFGPFGANPDLDPETSRSADIGIEKTYGNGSYVSATLFYTEVDDLIGYTTAYNQVEGTSVSKGVEIEGEWVATDRISVFGAFTFTDARDADGDPLQRVPRYALDLGINARLTDALSLSANVQRRADFAPTFGATGFTPQDVKDHTVVNAQADYTFNNGTTAYLRVENLFDEQYEVIPGYQTSDRAAYFGIRATF
ncbi:TonB-dependent receptor [Thalassococcus sp. CAU 1522]|uniref:TonB-dependent receptor n=1 Tax=Thalassococcus arenae TaxID=2851652 RepID=A0ABS6N934_9RHOB|nr:TonB-dependent receptor [Thalassococcus arenae]MBV2360507.1 TonB-dependent receptor [Thalassococcus arenae]